MARGVYPEAKFIPTVNFGYPPGAKDQMTPLGICDHIAAGPKAVVDDPTFWDRMGTSAHFIVGKDGSVSQFVNLFDVAYAQGLASRNLDQNNKAIGEALRRGAGLRPFDDGTGRVYAIDRDGCNVFNRCFVGIEHEGQSEDQWTPAMLKADIALKRWILRELDAAGRGFPLDSLERLIGHFMLDPRHRAGCPGPHWPRQQLWDTLTAPDTRTNLFIAVALDAEQIVANGHRLAAAAANADQGQCLAALTDALTALVSAQRRLVEREP